MPNTPTIKPFRCNNAECQRELAYTDGTWLLHGIHVGGVFVEMCRDERAAVTLRCPCGTVREWRRVKSARVSTVSTVPVAVGV